jgi:hypothetical protein
MSVRWPLGIGLVSALACGGGSEKVQDSAGNPDQDVRGVYALTWSGVYTLRMDIGGAVQEQQANGETGIVTFNAPDGSPLEIDLAGFCADPAVVCPSEVLPDRVAIDQDDPLVEQDVHSLRMWDPEDPSVVRSGLVRHETGQFLFTLEGEGDGDSSCGALALSLAGGTFAQSGAAADSADTAIPPSWSITNGKVAVGWLGVCAWEGLAVAATLSMETSYTGSWESALP